MISSSAAQRQTCPKCGHARAPTGRACARCGLVYALWKPEAAVGVVANLDDAGEGLWESVISDWRSTPKHDAFVKHCSVTSTLGAAGRRYREHLDGAPGDPIALAMQARIVAMATVQLPAHAAQPPEPVTRSKWFWAVMALFALIGLLAGMVVRK